MHHKLSITIAILLTGLTLTGCATKKYVNAEVSAAEARSDIALENRAGEVESQVEANQARLDEQEGRLDELSKTSRDALDRAQAAGKLAEGKLLYETVLTDENVRFGLSQADLSTQATAALDEFATKLLEENANVFIEIQGHTDSTGSESFNMKLGQQRAESVMRYLNSEHRIPLHRMSAVSYGEAAPIADNATREGRAQNRRVVLVVLS